MTPLAVGTTVAVLAFIGLAIGLVVFGVVVWLLNGVLSPLRKILADVKYAQTAPMLERGVPGTDQLGQTRRLAESVPDLAMAYLQKLSLSGSSPAPAPSSPAAPSSPPPAGPQAPDQPAPDPQQPAWKAYR